MFEIEPFILYFHCPGSFSLDLLSRFMRSARFLPAPEEFSSYHVCLVASVVSVLAVRAAVTSNLLSETS